MGPEALAQVLRPLADAFDPGSYPDLLRGLTAPDDAAVWRLAEDRALVLSADFFPPVVDDPYRFGAIAAANSLSDLYAMGAEPLMGINLVGFPEDLDPGILAAILRGGADKTREAGAVIAGGHTTTDHEPKYGLAVIGLVDPRQIWEKGGARAGDRLLLTKPIGTGVVTTAHKREQVAERDLQAAVESMSRLHRRTAEVVRSLGGGLHAATDVTGFSLAGHAHEMAHQSGLVLRLRWSDVPRLPGSEGYAREGHVTGGGRRNGDYYRRWIRFGRELADWEEQILFDPQTSGGLLLSVGFDRADEFERALREVDEPVWSVGEVVAGEAGTLELV
jgi:selenide,water dikinase